MRFSETSIKGAYIIDIEPIADERGFFARSWCREEFLAHGLNGNLAQCSISFNRRKGTLRGMHYQVPPYGEAKLVRCTQGKIYDVIVDICPSSPTFKQWIAVELTADNRRALYVPANCAHGFQTLQDDCEILYYMSEFYTSTHARGVRWNDAAFGIEWPDAERVMSARDQQFADFAF